MGYQNVIFDLDGTLIDSAVGIEKAIEKVYQHFHMPYTSLDDFRVFIGPPLRVSFPEHGIEEKDVETAVTIFRNFYINEGKYQCAPFEGIEALLEYLVNHGRRCYVSTSKPEHVAKDVLHHFHLDRYFDAIAGATMDGKRDNKDEIILHLFKIADIRGECVMVGDTKYDVIGAKKVGIDSIGVTWGFGKEEELKEANHIVKSTEALRKVVCGI